VTGNIVQENLFRETGNLIARHKAAVVLFPVLASLFLFEVLFLDKSLSGFDIVLAQPNWQSEFGDPGTPNRALADSPTAHFPELRLQWELLKRGQSPNFNPYIFSGIEAMTQGVGAFVTSLHQLILDTPSALDWTTWFRLILAGLFMYAFLLRIGINQACAIFGGIAWTYGLPQIVWLQFPQHLATQLWMPLLLLLNIEIIRNRKNFSAIVGLIVVNILFYTSGYTQIVLYTYLVIGVFNTILIFSNNDNRWVERCKSWISVHVVYIAAIIILLPAIWFDAQQLENGLRSIQTYRLKSPTIEWSPQIIVEMIRNWLPDLNDVVRWTAPGYHGGIWGKPYHNPEHGNLVEGAAYFGIVSLVCVPFALFYRHKVFRYGLVAALIVPLLLFLGLHHRDTLKLGLVNAIPYVGFGNYDRTITIIFFILCILAALGLQKLMNALAAIHLGWPLTILLTPVAVLGFITWYSPDLRVNDLLQAGITLGIFGALVFLFTKTRRIGYIPVVAIIMATLDLVVVSYGFNTKLNNDLVFPQNDTIRKIVADDDVFRVAVIGEAFLYRPNILAYYGLPIIDGYSNLVPKNYIKLIKSITDEEQTTANGILYLHKVDTKLLRLFNVKYVITDRLIDDAQLDLVHNNDYEHLYQIRNSLPRVYCASDLVTVASSEQALQLFADAASDYDRPLLANVEKDKASEQESDCVIKDLEVYTNGLGFQSITDNIHYAIFPYNYSEHWKLSINGDPADVIRGNFFWLAARLPEGKNRVSLIYANPLQTISSVIQIVLGLILIIGSIKLARSNPAPIVWVVVGLLILGKNLTGLPGIRNDAIPETALRPAANTDQTLTDQQELITGKSAHFTVSDPRQ